MVDWAEVAVVIEVAVLAVSTPFVFLSWASGYLDIMARQAKRNHWMAPSLSRFLGRHPPDPSAEWEREFGPMPREAFARPKVKSP